MDVSWASVFIYASLLQIIFTCYLSEDFITKMLVEGIHKRNSLSRMWGHYHTKAQAHILSEQRPVPAVNNHIKSRNCGAKDRLEGRGLRDHASSATQNTHVGLKPPNMSSCLSVSEGGSLPSFLLALI
jgi:hypothetical protein